MPEPYRIMYDYSDVPVIKKFAQSDKRIKGLLGPFGPLSNDTEYLTPLGWKQMDQYDDGDLVAQCDVAGNTIFDRPIHYIVQPCEEFIHFKTLSLDMMLSPEHRVLVQNRYGEMQVFLAQEMYDQHHKGKPRTDDLIPVTFNYKNDASLPLSEDELRLTVAVLADGSFHKHMKIPNATYNTNRCAMGFRKDRKKDRIKYLLGKLNIPYKESPAPNGTIYFYFQAPIKKKIYDSYFWSASYEQRKIICDEIQYWDGNKRSDGIIEFYSTVKESVDFIQYCFASTGVGCSVRTRPPGKGKWGKTIGHEARSFSSAMFAGIPRKTEAIQYEKYGNGFKYCFETKTGFFVARRNGKIFITGNSGKSSGCIMEIIRRGHEQAPSQDGIRRTRWAIIRATYPQLKDTTIRTVFDWLPPSVFGEYSVTNHNYVITKFPGVQIELMFRALDRPEQVANLLSLELTGAWVNEAREVNWEIIDALDGRINRYPGKKDGGCTWCGIIMDTNPPDENSEWYKYFEVKRPSTAAIFKQPSGLSPQAENLKNLAKDYYKTLAIGKNDQYVRVYIEGKYGYTQEGKAVIEQYNDNVHVALSIIQPMEDVPLIAGMDFGLNPTLILGQITPRGKLLILDEYGGLGGLRQFCNNTLIPQLRINYFGVPIQGGYGDPAGKSRGPTDESTCYEVLREVGLKQVLPCPTNDLLPRIAAVENLLTKMIDGEPALVISPKCVMLRKALNGGYHRQRVPGTQNEYSDQPFKNIYCTSLDTEILTFDGWKKYDEIKISDKVFGYKDGSLIEDEILSINQYKNAPIVAYASKHDKYIYTPDHRCLVLHVRNNQELIVPAKDLTTNHAMISVCEDYEYMHKKKMNFTNDFIKICAWVQTEGHYRKDGSIVICQSNSHNPEYVKELDRLLPNYKRQVWKNGEIVSWKITREIAYLIHHLMPNKYPSSEFIMAMKNSQKRLFIYECIRGDGFNGGTMPNRLKIHRAREFWLNRKYANGQYITPRISAKDKKSLDALQMMCVMCGIKTSLRNPYGTAYGSMWALSLIKNTKTIGIARMEKTEGFSDVWCPTTKSGFWVSRSNGMVIITGNSHYCDALEYLCYYVNDSKSKNKRNEEFLKRIGKQTKHRPASSIAGM